MDQKYKDIVNKQIQMTRKEKVIDPQAEKAKKKARKVAFFEDMGAQVDKISLQRYMDENKNLYLFSMDQKEQRKLVDKKLSASQRILFINRDNPFEGSDGFAHLLHKGNQNSQL